MSTYRSLLLLLALLVLPASAAANMANPTVPGALTGEVTGDISQLSVEREELVFDLRGLADGSPGRIEATYQIRNPHDDMPLALQFVAANLEAGADNVSVTLDGRPVDARLAPDAPVPDAWTLGDSASYLLNQTASEPTGDTATTSIFFEVDLPAGRHEISVSYPVTPWTNGAMPGANELGPSLDRHNSYLVPYVLAPAREWGSFGELTVEVRVPDRWDVATSPALEEAHGNVMSGSFDGIPARGFYVETRPQFIHSWRALLGLVFGLAVPLGLVFLLPFWLGKRPRGFSNRWSHDGAHSPLTVALSAAIAALAGLAAVPVGFIVHWIVTASAHVYAGWAYLMLYVTLLSVPVAFLVSLVVYGIGVRVGRRG